MSSICTTPKNAADAAAKSTTKTRDSQTSERGPKFGPLLLQASQPKKRPSERGGRAYFFAVYLVVILIVDWELNLD